MAGFDRRRLAVRQGRGKQPHFPLIAAEERNDEPHPVVQAAPVVGAATAQRFQPDVKPANNLQAALVIIGGWAFFFALPIVNASATAIMQMKIEPDVQGRVFAFRRMISGGAIPIACLFSGPLADYIFEPLMAQEGPLVGSVGQIIGTGDGRGIALLFIVAAIFLVVLTAGGLLYQPLRFIEDRLPDVIL